MTSGRPCRCDHFAAIYLLIHWGGRRCARRTGAHLCPPTKYPCWRWGLRGCLVTTPVVAVRIAHRHPLLSIGIRSGGVAIVTPAPGVFVQDPTVQPFSSLGQYPARCRTSRGGRVRPTAPGLCPRRTCQPGAVDSQSPPPE